MSTISDQLTLLNNTKTAIRNSINAKGGSVTASTPFADYASAITNLPSGGDNSTLIDLIERDITSINIPSGTTSIGKHAFYYCENLTNVTIPNTVTSIGDGAFFACSRLNNVTIPSSVTSMYASQIFAYCTSLTSVTIPDSVTTIGQWLFDCCNAMREIIVGSGVTSIGQNGFSISMQNTSLQKIIVKATTPPTLGNNAFDATNNCPIYVPSASVAAYKAASGWSTYESRIFAIEDAVTLTPTNGDPAISVKNYELATAGYVQSTDVPSTIKNGAGSLEIGEGVTRIGTFAFQNGASLTSVTIPSTLTRIDEAAFNGCSSLTGVTVNATTPPTLYSGAFDQTGNCPIYVPGANVADYQAASGWSTYSARIQAIPSPQAYPLFAPASQTVSVSDYDSLEGTVPIPIKLYYSDGTERTVTYYNSAGRQQNYIYNSLSVLGTVADPNEDLIDTTIEGTDNATYDSTDGWVTYYDVSLVLPDPEDPSPLIGKTATFSTPGIGVVLPAEYEEESGTWVQTQQSEMRTGSFTVTFTA